MADLLEFSPIRPKLSPSSRGPVHECPSATPPLLTTCLPSTSSSPFPLPSTSTCPLPEKPPTGDLEEEEQEEAPPPPPPPAIFSVRHRSRSPSSFDHPPTSTEFPPDVLLVVDVVVVPSTPLVVDDEVGEADGVVVVVGVVDNVVESQTPPLPLPPSICELDFGDFEGEFECGEMVFGSRSSEEDEDEGEVENCNETEGGDDLVELSLCAVALELGTDALNESLELSQMELELEMDSPSQSQPQSFDSVIDSPDDLASSSVTNSSECVETESEKGEEMEEEKEDEQAPRWIEPELELGCGRVFCGGRSADQELNSGMPLSLSLSPLDCDCELTSHDWGADLSLTTRKMPLEEPGRDCDRFVFGLLGVAAQVDFCSIPDISQSRPFVKPPRNSTGPPFPIEGNADADVETEAVSGAFVVVPESVSEILSALSSFAPRPTCFGFVTLPERSILPETDLRTNRQFVYLEPPMKRMKEKTSLEGGLEGENVRRKERMEDVSFGPVVVAERSGQPSDRFPILDVEVKMETGIGVEVEMETEIGGAAEVKVGADSSVEVESVNESECASSGKVEESSEIVEDDEVDVVMVPVSENRDCSVDVPVAENGEEEEECEDISENVIEEQQHEDVVVEDSPVSASSIDSARLDQVVVNVPVGQRDVVDVVVAGSSSVGVDSSALIPVIAPLGSEEEEEIEEQTNVVEEGTGLVVSVGGQDVDVSEEETSEEEEGEIGEQTNVVEEGPASVVGEETVLGQSVDVSEKKEEEFEEEEAEIEEQTISASVEPGLLDPSVDTNQEPQEESADSPVNLSVAAAVAVAVVGDSVSENLIEELADVNLVKEDSLLSPSIDPDPATVNPSQDTIDSVETDDGHASADVANAVCEEEVDGNCSEEVIDEQPHISVSESNPVDGDSFKNVEKTLSSDADEVDQSTAEAKVEMEEKNEGEKEKVKETMDPIYLNPKVVRRPEPLDDEVFVPRTIDEMLPVAAAHSTLPLSTRTKVLSRYDSARSSRVWDPVEAYGACAAIDENILALSTSSTDGPNAATLAATDLSKMMQEKVTKVSGYANIVKMDHARRRKEVLGTEDDVRPLAEQCSVVYRSYLYMLESDHASSNPSEAAEDEAAEEAIVAEEADPVVIAAQLEQERKTVRWSFWFDSSSHFPFHQAMILFFVGLVIPFVHIVVMALYSNSRNRAARLYALYSLLYSSAFAFVLVLASGGIGYLIYYVVRFRT